jgi:hypothetical protein
MAVIIMEANKNEKVILTFIALKYQLPTETNFIYGQNKKNQELLNTYPEEVVKTWAWRCAEDVEYRAITAEAKEVYRVARLFRAGMATKEELDKAAYAADHAYATHAAYAAATMAACRHCRRLHHLRPCRHQKRKMG